jgi:CRP-like cAMP-binding protein
MESVFDFFDKYMPLSLEAQNIILNTFDEVHHKKGEIIITEGKLNPYLFVIKKGIVRGFIATEHGERTVTLWQENEPFGEINEQLAVRSYQVLEDSVMYRFNAKLFRKLFDTNLEIGTLGRLMLEKYFHKNEISKHQYDKLTVLQKYMLFVSERPGMIHRVKFIHIASYLNMSPETFSRILSTMVKFDE